MNNPILAGLDLSNYADWSTAMRRLHEHLAETDRLLIENAVVPIIPGQPAVLIDGPAARDIEERSRIFNEALEEVVANRPVSWYAKGTVDGDDA